MYSYTLSSTSVLDGGWSTPRPDRFTPGKDTVPNVQEAGLAPGPVWTGAKNLAHTGVRSQCRPARSELLYRLSYPGPFTFVITELKSILYKVNSLNNHSTRQ